MYEKLYNEDAYTREFESDVISVKEKTYENETVYDFVLEKTCFFPEQGGQTCDTGKLSDLNSSTTLEVVHVYIEDDTVHHLVKLGMGEGAVHPVGIQRVKGAINWEERFDKMQNHSGEHLVSGTVHRFFGLDNVGFSLSNDNVTLDFNGTLTEENLEFIEKTVNRAVFENFEVQVTYPSEEELKSIDYRSKKELSGEVRIVEFPGYDICACCAPHVHRTGEIGLIKIISTESFKGGIRMTIRCGYRALYDYARKLNSCRKISQMLSVPVDDVAAGVEKISSDNRSLKFEMNGMNKTVLDLKAENVRKDANPIIFDDKADMNSARKTINEMLTGTSGFFGIFLGDEQNGYGFCIGSKKHDCRKLLYNLKTILGAKGGGNETMIQGNIKASPKAIKKLLETFQDENKNE